MKNQIISTFVVVGWGGGALWCPGAAFDPCLLREEEAGGTGAQNPPPPCCLGRFLLCLRRHC